MIVFFSQKTSNEVEDIEKKIKALSQDDLPSFHMSFEHATEWANNAVIVAAAK